jgi:hypothetical protein
MSPSSQSVSEAITAILGPCRTPGRWRVLSGASVWLADQNGIAKVGISTVAWSPPEHWRLVHSPQDLEQVLEQVRALALKTVLGA